MKQNLNKLLIDEMLKKIYNLKLKEICLKYKKEDK